MDSSASTMTLQGKAIKRASIKFGDGKTLPFCPCKRGYIPVPDNNNNNNNKTQLVACSFHEKARRKRLARDKGKLRGGEADPKSLFWDNKAQQDDLLVVKNPPKSEPTKKGKR
mmetsp:Transcript_6544/g.15911  ORF Transcript_6544/g.15911 Transcript_6544/m.15911 type:complete len:113 (-) Transcript_6544:304-642(-)